MPLSGITKDIELQFVNNAKIDYLGITQRLEDGKAFVSVKADVTSFGNYECEIGITSPSGEVMTACGECAEFVIDNPELWWTYELSGSKNQPLYTVSAKLKLNGKVLDEQSKKIGLRTIELNREQRDKYGRNFQFILNGVPLFIKGSNYIPADSFITRFDKQKLDYMLDAVQFSNMNKMICVWAADIMKVMNFTMLAMNAVFLFGRIFSLLVRLILFLMMLFLKMLKGKLNTM